MTPNAGLAGARSLRAARRVALPRGAFALGLLLVACVAARAGEGGGAGGKDARDRSLDGPVALIEGAFRSGRPEPLMSLLPADARTLVFLRSAGCAGGYYSRDQVYFILSSVFTRRETVRFSVRQQRSADPPRESESSKEGTAPISCVGTWTFRGRDGTDGETQVHFVLFMRKGAWSLAEIREAQ